MITEDALLGGCVRLLQPRSGLRATTDTVFLAAACPVQNEAARGGKSARILDLGCGTGAAGLCVLARAPSITLTGVDFQPDLIDLAGRNAALNGFESRTSFVCCDIRAFETSERFDHVLCNPPYLEAGAHTRSPHTSKAAACGPGEKTDASLKDWIDAAFRLLHPHGTLTLIHRTEALDRIIQALGKRFGALEIIPLWPRAGQAALRTLVRAHPNRRTGLILHPGFVMHNPDGSYAIDADRILKSPCAL